MVLESKRRLVKLSFLHEPSVLLFKQLLLLMVGTWLKGSAANFGVE